jgi:hypothetical protein
VGVPFGGCGGLEGAVAVARAMVGADVEDGSARSSIILN